MTNEETSDQAVVLVVDDEATHARLISRWLGSEGYETEIALDGESCLKLIHRVLPDVVCLDVNMPGIGGLETLRRLKSHHPRLPVVMLTAEDSVETAVASMQAGAYGYLTKPVDKQRLFTEVQQAVEHSELSLRVAELERESGEREYDRLQSRSDAMKPIFRQLDRVVASDVTVLLQGESGTGKELVAREIHDNSGRSDGPFIVVNCASIPEGLQESELFGHEEGAFTGATQTKPGTIEQADGGTLFLDEIAELRPSLQASLLRVLQDSSFQRLGSQQTRESDFRLISATHKRLLDEVDAGSFREDLYYRIAVFEMTMPPLRVRAEDIALLTRYFLEEFREIEGKPELDITQDALRALIAHEWPGNIRELKNAVQRAAVAADDMIRVRDLPDVVQEAAEAVGLPALRAGLDETSSPAEIFGEDDVVLPLQEVERLAIKRAYRLTDGNISKMSRMLGVSRATLYRKLDTYGLR
jgi:DNA-binding NtrC family response regulator